MDQKRYSLGEEIFNSVTHGLGAVLSIAGIVLLIIKSALAKSPIAIISSIIFGVMLILLYTMSTLYHSITHKKAKNVLRIFDHCSIFLLIAGTYMPYMLVSIGGAVGITVVSILWGIAILGIVLNAISIERFKVFSLICYVIMGWTIIMFIKPMTSVIAPGGMLLLLFGGIAYTGGLIFYGLKKIPYMHSIWHLCVLGGSILHYFSVLFYVI